MDGAVGRAWIWTGLLCAAAAFFGCARPAPTPAPTLSLQPVEGDGWQTFEAKLAGSYTDPAAAYDGVYPTRKQPTRFRIEVRVPRYAGNDTVGPSLIEHLPGQPPAKKPYVVVRVYAGSTRLTFVPERIVPRGPCGPAGTPPTAVPIGVHVDADGVRSVPPPADAWLADGPFQAAYSRIYVAFDTEPGQLATCALDFSAAIGDGKLSIPPLRLVSDVLPQYAPSVHEASASQ